MIATNIHSVSCAYGARPSGQGGHFQMIQGVSDEALAGIVKSLAKNPRSYFEGSWEHGRLIEAKDEVARRKAKRRGRAVA